MDKKIWIIGAGQMAQDYVKVLKALNKDFIIIGRGEQSAQKCTAATHEPVIQGGLQNFLKTADKQQCLAAIVAVTATELSVNAALLLDFGIQNILLEKPGAIKIEELESLEEQCVQQNASIYIAYNRRFYASFLAVQEMLAEDGGLQSFNFEFTEWSHKIGPTNKAKAIKENWFILNSTHVLDIAFHIGGKPKELACFSKGDLGWHNPSMYSGAGISDKDALFSYQANWESAGRWVVEFLSNKRRYIFKPMEKLQVQQRGKIAVDFIEIDDSLDLNFKPGLYKQCQTFLSDDRQKLCSLNEQIEMFKIYNRIKQK